jgi:hypothetical protein
MEDRATNQAAGMPPALDRGVEPPARVLWVAPLVAVGIAYLTLDGAGVRLQLLRIVLISAAAGEGFAAVMQVFFARSFGERNGRPYDPAYHGLVQDFGFYNLAVALLFALAALDPEAGATTIRVGIVLYAVHGSTHLLRWAGLYYGGETRVPTRARRLELRDGLTLAAPLAGMILFFP